MISIENKEKLKISTLCILLFFSNCILEAQNFWRKPVDTTLMIIEDCDAYLLDEIDDTIKRKNVKKLYIDCYTVNECELNKQFLHWDNFPELKILEFHNSNALDPNVRKQIEKYSFSPSIYYNKSIREIYFHSLIFTEIPVEIGYLDSLEVIRFSLVMGANKLPEFFCNLKNLKVLVIESTSIPSCIYNCEKLHTLSNITFEKMSKSEIDSLFSIMSKIPNLETIHIGLRKYYYPFHKYKFEKIKSIVMSDWNKSADVYFSKPENLPNLNKIDISWTTINKIPSCLGNFNNLDSLIFSKTKVRRITNDVVKLQNIKYIYANKLSKRQIKKLKKFLPNCEIDTGKN